MRYLYLFIAATLFVSCKKDPLNATSGQVVTLFVDHYATAGDQKLYVLPSKTPATTYLEGFDERELGYTYEVKAQMYIPKDPPQDGPDRWYKFVRVVSKERYFGTEPFEISLKNNSIFGSTLAVWIDKNIIYYSNYVLIPENEAVKKQLDELVALRQKFHTDQDWANNVVLKATVTHDPNNRAKGYLVSNVIVQ
ncbi:hypothetical protein [Pedobacter endophyticus]|uniref:DUF4377 domain-containing protein n=1 Tax=Pedobacter endophyticus TaxID=2789740 RepID=A0A7S9L381_9SPHI|nr:hypothetical protein [Pedobacter endophyticus]QPH41656.1 hypothetical protein IZT61_10570 [Pedobacter endophyticus]